jgi:hypothetical protein
VNETLSLCNQILSDVGFLTQPIQVSGREASVFENGTVIGFVLTYDHASDLIHHWERDSNRVVADFQLMLRRAGQKAWNAYVVLLAREANDDHTSVALSAIEEDLVGTRKIARAGLKDSGDVRAALLPLLPLQSAPKLEAVDMISEIRLRTTEIPQRSIEAFLSSADESVVLQVMEQLE